MLGISLFLKKIALFVAPCVVDHSVCSVIVVTASYTLLVHLLLCAG